MKKRIAVALVLSGILAASGQASEIPHCTLEELPVIDGSLACVPLMKSLIMEMTGCSENKAEEALSAYTNTMPSYRFMAHGERDLLLAYEASEDIKREIENFDSVMHLEPIGKDALVFIENADNPVNSLTQEEILKIFTGEIANWSEVGGEDCAIEAFQRPENSGSQTLMRKLLAGDAQLKQNIEQIPSMEGLIDALKIYDNEASAIGYSVFYYASNMYEQPDLKFLKVDGIEVSAETIADGSYPLTNPFYAVTADTSSDLAKEIAEWLISEDGQAFVEANGYVPVR